MNKRILSGKVIMSDKDWNKVRRLSLFEVEVFVHLIKHMNSNEVSKVLSVQASKISRTLSTLRDIFEDRLFIRKKHGFEPTPVAKKLYPLLDDVLNSAYKVSSRNDRCLNGHRKQIRISIPPILSAGLINFLNEEAVRREDDIEFAVAPWSGVFPKVEKESKIEISIYYARKPYPEIQSTLVSHKSETRIVASADHAIWSDIESVESRIFKYPFIVNECVGFNDVVDPLEEYGDVIGKRAKVEARVGTLEALVEQLHKGTAFSFFMGKGCKDYFENCLHLRTEVVDKCLMDKVSKLTSSRGAKPSVYMHINNEKECPRWVVYSLTKLIQEYVGT